jgi:hypothetical protein
MGEHAKATQEAAALVPTGVESGELLYKLAAVYALAAAAARRDEKLAAADRGLLADRYAARALELLSRASASSSGKGRLSKLEKDPDFDGLRSQTSFKKLLESVKKHVTENRVQGS